MDIARQPPPKPRLACAARHAFVVAILACVLPATTHAATNAAAVPHPFLLWTRADLASIRKRIDTEAWARDAYARMVESKDLDADLRGLFRVAVMGDEEQAGKQK